MGPTQPVYDATSATGYYNWPGNTLTSPDNPLEILSTSSDQATTDRSTGDLTARYDFSALRPLRGLTAGVTLGYDVAQASRVVFYPNNIHFETKSGTDGTFFEMSPVAPIRWWTSRSGTCRPWRPAPGISTWDSATPGGTRRRVCPQRSSSGLSTNLLGPNGIPQSATPPVASLETDHSALTSVYGRVGYDLANRYFLSASVRRDGSTRFGAANKWATFPAVGAAWRVPGDPGGRRPANTSWGRTGNQDFGSGLSPSTFSPCGLGPGCLAVDPNLTWETSRTWDVGADFGVGGRRLTGSVDWYSKHTDNLLFVVPVSRGTAGFSNYVLTNAGSLRNTGVELGVTAVLMRAEPREGLSWTATFNASHNANELLSLNPILAGGGGQILTGGIVGGVGSTIQVLEPGQPVNSFLVCRQVYSGGKPVEGEYQTLSGADTTACARGTNSVAEHDPAPHWILGLTSILSYRRIDLSFALRAWVGI